MQMHGLRKRQAILLLCHVIINLFLRTIMQINHIATLYATLYSLQNLLILCASPIDCAYDKFHYLLMVGHSLLCSLVQVVALKVDGCPKVWVVTSDSVQQQAAHGAVSALIQSRLLKLLSIYLFYTFKTIFPPIQHSLCATTYATSLTD